MGFCREWLVLLFNQNLFSVAYIYQPAGRNVVLSKIHGVPAWKSTVTYGDDESGDKAEIGNPLPKFTFHFNEQF